MTASSCTVEYSERERTPQRSAVGQTAGGDALSFGKRVRVERICLSRVLVAVNHTEYELVEYVVAGMQE